MKSYYDLIKRPLFTEKENNLKEKENKIVIEIDRRANKIEIKKAVEKVLNVKVEKVWTINCRGKKKRVGRHEGMTSPWKKAIVKLKEGESIDFLEGVF